MSSSEISNSMYNALKLKYQSDLLTAKSSLLVYFSNSVGIGEHPYHIEEMDKLIDAMASAQDKLDILENHFTKFKLSSNVEEIRRASP